MTDTNEQQQQQHKQDVTLILSHAILFMLSLLVINEVLINAFNKLCLKHPFLRRYINGPILTTSLGMLAGTYLLLGDSSIIIDEYQAGFSEFFLIILLPPILFESAINMEKALFFQNFGSILAFAIGGTLVATIITSLLVYSIGYIGLATQLGLTQSFAFGALVSATDPVAVLGLFKTINADKTLYILIYGESILNDAISILLYQICAKIELGQVVGTTKAIEQFLLVFIFSIFIGFLIGIICAYILKIKAELTVETEHIEVSVTVIIPWVSYLIAEALGFSGIVSIVFCGLAMARYALPNLSDNGKLLLNKFYHLLAYNFENLVFLFIGIGIVGFDLAWNEMGVGLGIGALLIVMLARFGNISGISYLLNCSRQQNHIKPNHIKAFWFAGLRGAMAYALALNSVEIFSNNGAGQIILTVTIIIVTINIFVQGMLLVPMMEFWDIQEKPAEQEMQLKGDELLMVEKGCIHKLKDCIEKCDEKILQEYLIKKREESPAGIRHSGAVHKNEEKSQLKSDMNKHDDI